MPRPLQSSPRTKPAAPAKVRSQTSSTAQTTPARSRPAAAHTASGVETNAPAPAPLSLFAGTSGWAYSSWKPGFYPPEVPARSFLHFYATNLSSVEVNYTFRTLPSAAQLQSWLDATPPGFRFSFKAPQRLTHFQRLRVTPELTAALASFLAAIEPARAAARLGPLLFQLPPNFRADTARLAAFLDLPALSLPPLQLAFEFRHAGWFTDATYDLLRSRNVALCVAEGGDLTTPDIATATFRYHRLRRNGGYTAAQIKAFATRFTDLARQGEVFVYFRHEDAPTGARNALALLRHATKLQHATKLRHTATPIRNARPDRPPTTAGVRA